MTKAPNGLRSRSMALYLDRFDNQGGHGLCSGAGKKSKRRNCLKMAANPQHPVHALLGAFCFSNFPLNII
jgi:hypothetical protein